jgi:hypothetical protein
MIARSRPIAAPKRILELAALLASLLAPALAQAARLGDLDRSFGNHGKAKAGYGLASSVAVDSRERIVLAGTYFDLVRFRPRGAPDESFGGDGLATTPFPDPGGYPKAYGRSMAIDSQDRLVAAGSLCRYADSDYHELIGCQVALRPT